MLVIISGASGVGKSTLCGRLLAEFDELEMSVSFTTRAARGQERDGVHYHFVDGPTFGQMVEQGEFAEWAEVHGNRYGTARRTIGEALAAGRSVLFDIDYQGAESLLRTYGDAVAVMVLPPSMEALEARLRRRGDTAEEVIARRMAAARREIAHFRSFGYVLINDDLEQTYERLRAIVLAEKQRTARVGEQLVRRLGITAASF